ncbi:MAG: hypothetical protein ACLGH8_14375 [Bacteroidia bacterium]
MTSNELYLLVLDKLGNPSVQPLHKAMLEECCEHAVASELSEIDSLVLAAQVAFMTCDNTLRATLKASAEAADADKITLNYRNQSFTIDRYSPYLKNSDSFDATPLENDNQL